MCVQQNYMPVVVMIDEKDTADGLAAREWLENSRFNTAEAHDVFEALEEMGDFTTELRPDLIVLDVGSCKADLPIIKGALESIHESEVPIVAISNTSEPSFQEGTFEGNLEAAVAQLYELIPEHPVV